MSLEAIIGIIGIIINIALANKVLKHLEGLLKFTAGFIFVVGFIGIIGYVLPEDDAALVIIIYLFALIIWFITGDGKSDT